MNLDDANKIDMNFYNQNMEQEPLPPKKSNSKNWKVAFILILVILIIAAGVIFITKNNKENSMKFVIEDSEVEILMNEEYKINYDIINPKTDNINIHWNISDEDIIVINNNKIIGKKEGTTNVEGSFTYNGEKYVQSFNVTVKSNKSLDVDNPVIEYKTSASLDDWSKEDVTITLTITDDSLVKTTYTVNCENNETKDTNSDIENKNESGNDTSENVEKTSTSTCETKEVVDNTIVISENGENKIKVIATDENENVSEKEIIVKIDKNAPTCNLEFDGENIKAINEEKESGLKYYGTSNSFEGNNMETFTGSEGVHTYYLIDNAGNQNSCTIELATKTQYRSRTCKSCKSCRDAGCGEFWGKNAPKGASEWTCKAYKKSCETCGGCDTWNEYGEWQDTEINKSNSVTVETRNVLYQK